MKMNVYLADVLIQKAPPNTMTLTPGALLGRVSNFYFMEDVGFVSFHQNELLQST